MPAALVAVAAIIGGVVTSAVLLVGLLSLVGSTTQPGMLGLAGPVVILPAGLVAVAAGFYTARRLWATLRRPTGSDEGAP